MSSRQPLHSSTDSTPAQPAFDWRVAVAIAWLVGFCFYFYTFTLPNNPQFSRVDLWLYLIAQPDLGPAAQAVPSGLRFLAQRFSLIVVATFVMAGSWSLGRLVLRALRVSTNQHCSENFALAFGLGLAAQSLLTLLLGVCGFLSQPLFGVLIGLSLLAETILSLRKRNTSGEQSRDVRPQKGPALLPSLIVLAVVPFLAVMLFGSLLPSTDFDVKEYHLQGPKEFYLDGRIHFLPHNVYTSFPFLTEMLSLTAMVVYGDWYWGALAGKAVLMCFAPLTALTLFAAGRRWFGTNAGLLAALIHLSTPWVYRISIIAYAEGGLSFFVAVSLFAIMLAVEQIRKGENASKELLVAGLLAGSAMACKYPGLVQVVLPLIVVTGVVTFLSSVRNSLATSVALKRVVVNCSILLLGVAITIGPWLVKNTLETGNPVYPLAYSIFGGKDWDPALNAKWKAGHSSTWDTYTPANLAWSIVDVSARNDWLSPLLYALAPLAFFCRPQTRTVAAFWGYVVWLFLAWWLLTHRLDRFWVPMIPLVSLLAGVGATWTVRRGWSVVLGICIASAVVFNFSFITTGLCGYNEYLADLNAARKWSANLTAPAIAYLNDVHQGGSIKVLSVGDAEVFDAEFPIVYNTVFDRSIFETWCSTGPTDGRGIAADMRSPEEIAQKLADEGITHVYVNWREILRYRMTYGYTDFVRASRFQELRDAGVLGDPLQLPFAYLETDRLSEAERNEVELWSPSLIGTIQGHEVFLTTEIFPVLGRSASSVK